jgi:predicted nucleic acid-binding protein
MEKLKIYLDTSVISAYFDFRKPLRQLITQKWFQNEIGNYDLYISSLVLEEINNNSNNILKSNMLHLLNEIGVSVLEIDKQSIKLAEHYRKEIIPKEFNDSLHLAISTINNLDAIVSWNFKHIVNLKTINVIHLINVKNNYKIIEIVSLENLGGDKYGNL